MTKLGSIEFDDRVLVALRENKLVIFAGAGVSMGAPSNLDSFWKLTCKIAEGTNQSPTQPLDRFLGNLVHSKVAVHKRALQLLTPPKSHPTNLHYHLLRLFGSPSLVRLVTTNFDLHFEASFQKLYGILPETYKAPALPIGYEFTGIVHVHGALPQAKDLVLTDTDFGRAYLTEGWARRFLVDVFRRYTVLFVGYQHDDVVMNYLARALPPEDVAGRFALTEDAKNWDFLGITPIQFKLVDNENSYQELYDGVERLADRVTRGALDWKIRLAELGLKHPPMDEEAIGEIEHAFSEVFTTRFFLESARDPEWVVWLDKRKYLDTLFTGGELNERDQSIALWLSQNFALQHADIIFKLLGAKKLQLNPVLWWDIARFLGVTKEPIEAPLLKRWTIILLATAPKIGRTDVALLKLAKRCAAEKHIDLAMRVFLEMSKHRLSIESGISWPDHEGKMHTPSARLECQLHAEYHALQEVWSDYLQPHLDEIAGSLISGIAHQLKNIHDDLLFWEQADREMDIASYKRSAIEPDEQDRYPEAIDVLINAARDTIEWLESHNISEFEVWREKLAASEMPLLRRLAIHAITISSNKSANDRLQWILDRVGLHNIAEHHEVYRAVAMNYANASDTIRQAVVNCILAYTSEAYGDRPAREWTARAHFDWLSWVLKVKPDCPFANEALAPIKSNYPHWNTSDHSEFTHWSGSGGWIGPQSPWSVEELLSRDPHEQIDGLLNFVGDRFDGPDRNGLLSAVAEACKQNPEWGFVLANILVELSLPESDLWPRVISGLQEVDLAADDFRRLLIIISTNHLHIGHSNTVALLLLSIVRDGGKPYSLELLDQANEIALPLWESLVPNNEDENVSDWLDRAINRPAGTIIEFWLYGLNILIRGKSAAERVLPECYRQWFSLVLQDTTSKGGMGRCLLAAQTQFFIGLDEEWTRVNILPLFKDQDSKKFSQAWDGFLAFGRFNPSLVEALMPAILEAPRRLDTDLSHRRRNFVKFYTSIVLFHTEDPTQELIPAFFEYASIEDRSTFSSHVGFLLRHMEEPAKLQLWDRWLRHYWENRLDGVPKRLDEAEILHMLNWLPHLGKAYPSAVTLALRFNPVSIRHSHLLFEFTETDWCMTYQMETAELLIYLCKCPMSSFHAQDLRKVSAQLNDLPSDLRGRLDEALART